MNGVKFNRKLKELQIKFLKADKPFNGPVARVRFENQVDRQAAFAALNGVEVDGVTWQVKLPADMGGETGAAVANQKRSLNTPKEGEDEAADEMKEGDDIGNMEGARVGATTVKDAVVPWHHIEYPHQLVKKYRAMRDILEKILKRVKRDSSAPPEWMVPILKQKTKWLACPLEQVIPSPFQDGYRNKTELTVGFNSEGKPAIGFLLGALRDGVMAVADPSEANSVSKVHAALHKLIEPFVIESNLPLWNRTTHTGFWRLLLLRSTVNDDSLVMLQVNPGAVTPELFDKVKIDLVKHITESNDPVARHGTLSIHLIPPVLNRSLIIFPLEVFLYACLTLFLALTSFSCSSVQSSPFGFKNTLECLT